VLQTSPLNALIISRGDYSLCLHSLRSYMSIAIFNFILITRLAMYHSGLIVLYQNGIRDPWSQRSDWLLHYHNIMGWTDVRTRCSHICFCSVDLKNCRCLIRPNSQLIDPIYLILLVSNPREPPQRFRLIA
jgi:hypothetical protein